MVLRLFLIVLILFLASCGINSDIFEGDEKDVATRFLGEYYRYQDYRKVKKYFHPKLLERIDAETHEDIVQYERIVMKGWSRYDIVLQEKKVKEDGKVLVIFKVKGVRRKEARDRTGSVTLMLDNERWKVIGFS